MPERVRLVREVVQKDQILRGIIHGGHPPVTGNRGEVDEVKGLSYAPNDRPRPCPWHRELEPGLTFRELLGKAHGLSNLWDVDRLRAGLIP